MKKEEKKWRKKGKIWGKKGKKEKKGKKGKKGGERGKKGKKNKRGWKNNNNMTDIVATYDFVSCRPTVAPTATPPFMPKKIYCSLPD